MMSRRLATALAAVGGVGLAVQARLNGQLTAELGSPVVTTLLSFLTGIAVLVPLFVARTGGLRLRDVRGPEWRRWWLLTGPLGAFLIVAISAGVPVLGVALVTVLTVAGQTVAGVVLDARGAAAGRVRLSPRRFASVATAVLGLGVTALAVPPRSNEGSVLVVAVLLVLAGVAASVQQAANGAITGASGSPVFAGLLTFLGGAVVLVVVVVVQEASGRLAPITWPPGERWWLYTGGLFGTAFVVLGAWVVRRIGVLILALAVVAGQLLGAIVLDVATGGPDIGWATMGAVVSVVIAVVLALDTSSSTTAASPDNQGRARPVWSRSRPG